MVTRERGVTLPKTVPVVCHAMPLLTVSRLTVRKVNVHMLVVKNMKRFSLLGLDKDWYWLVVCGVKRV
jgi:hypothetical protein